MCAKVISVVWYMFALEKRQDVSFTEQPLKVQDR